jgi:RimJ/RimL family protein N-acetyltransferase
VPTIKGMGDALIKILKNISSQLYINKLRATVHTKNQKALDLYVRNGFTEVCRDNKFITMELANG